VSELTSVLTGIQVRDRGCLVIVRTEGKRYEIETELTTAQARTLAKHLTTAADNIDAEAARLTA
jgi:hypothetical protein